MEYIYILHYDTENLGTVWSKAYRGQLSARKGLNKALAKSWPKAMTSSPATKTL